MEEAITSSQMEGAVAFVTLWLPIKPVMGSAIKQRAPISRNWPPRIFSSPHLKAAGDSMSSGPELVIAAPTDTVDAAMAAFVCGKTFWPYRKLAEQETRQRLAQRLRGWSPRVGVAAKGIEIRDLGYHWATILLPASVIDYVIRHELVHLVEANQTPLFWQHVGRALPDFELHKSWLAEQGGGYVSL
ncbi:MAG: YgjP-like metallopeptidase domain-containing protein [Cyanobium sp.]